MKLGYRWLGVCYVLLGIFLLITNFVNPSAYNLPTSFAFLMVIITGFFYLIEYFNKNLYLGTGFVVLVIMWILSLIQPLPPELNKAKYFIFIGVITLMILIMLKIILKAWKEDKKNIS